MRNNQWSQWSLVFSVMAMFLLTMSSPVFSQKQSSYTGTVTASQIAAAGGSAGIGLWEKKLNCHDEAECARKLVAAGGKYVLVTGKGTYALNDQVKAAQFAAQRVTVTGAFDSSKKIIEVAEVQPVNGTTSAGIQ